MISDKLDNLIAEAMKNHETEKLEVLRLIKTKLEMYWMNRLKQVY